MQAIILASGRGSRFIPITDYHPKPLLPAANRPLLDYLLTAVITTGITEILVTMGYASDQIQRYLTSSFLAPHIRPVLATNWEHSPLGSFQSVLPYLSAKTPCILIPGDLYISATNLQQLTKASEEVALLYDSQAHRPGTLLQLDSSQHIQEFTQSPAFVSEYYSGLPALKATPAFFEHTLATCKGEPSTILDLLQCWLGQGQSIRGIPVTDDGWFDVDTPADLIALNHHILSKGWPPTPVPSGTYLPPNTSMTGPVEADTIIVGENSRLEGPLLLGADIEIGTNCLIRDGSSLGDRTIVESNTQLSRCVTLPHTQVPPNAEVVSAVLDTKGNALH
ncbi:MAG: sugar phosphate nucleotidyltransferase [Candidatus Hermodarchaeota archaeon]